MVIRRRGFLIGLVTVGALVVCGCYLWMFRDDRGLVPFLLGCALLMVAVLHAVAWRESRSPLLIGDLTGLRVRLGGRWTGVTWADVETVEVAHRGRLGDGKVVVRPRDELRVLADLGIRARVAVMVNRWLYDAALVVPYGLTTTVSADDVLGTLTRLADGRVPVVAIEDRASEPEPTVEVAAAGTLRRDDPPEPFGDATPRATPPTSAPPTGTSAQGQRRLASVVSALRSQAGRFGEATVPIQRLPLHQEPVNVGSLALSDRLEEETEPLPELSELRRRAPEDEDPAPEQSDADRPSRTTNVELIIDATTDLTAQAMRKVRSRPEAGDYRSADVAPLDASASGGDAAGPAVGADPSEVIGTEIRVAREWLGLSVDDLAERTRIRPYVIESIEVGDFSPCGGDFYARGHLRMLASVLGIDPEPLVTSYDADVASAPVSPRAVFDAELTTGLLRPTGGGGSRWGVLIGAVLVLLLVWGLARFFLTDPTSDPGTLRLPTHNSAGLGSPGAGNTLLVPPPVPPTRVTLSVTEGDSRVVVWDEDQAVLYQGVLQAGESKTVSAEGPLRVMAVDGGVVSLTAKGHPKAPMAKPGERAFVRLG